jgi:hypothetical protein
MRLGARHRVERPTVVPHQCPRISLELVELTTSEDRAVTTLVPRIALGTIAILVAGTVVTDNNNSITTNINKPIYLGVLVFCLRRHAHLSTRSSVASV